MAALPFYQEPGGGRWGVEIQLKGRSPPAFFSQPASERVRGGGQAGREADTEPGAVLAAGQISRAHHDAEEGSAGFTPALGL